MTSQTSPTLSVILVEDDHALARVWKTLFGMLGYEITCFHTGQELLRQIEILPRFDIIISDYYLPDLNGVELIKEVRRAAPNLPAIVLTGSHETFIKEAVQTIANCQILYKPLDIGDVEAKLAEIFHPANSDS